MGVKVNIDKAIKDYYSKGQSTKFKDSLKSVLEWSKNDPNLNKLEHLAYLLATAKIESDYSTQRWEADYVCVDIGEPYKDKPCQSALNYYRSSDGKKNYYNLGLDSRGLPYFGRGLIQLTGKDNYDKYGKLIGKDLVKDPELALEPKNSFRIATGYMNSPKGSSGKSTFDHVDKGDLTQARKSVNGGTKDLSEVNKQYNLWLPILKANAKVSEGGDDSEEGGNKGIKRLITAGVVLATVGVTGIILYYVLKRTGKLPNFLKKVNL